MTPVFRARLASGLLAAAVLVPAPLVLLHDRLSGDAEPRAASSPTARRDGETAAGRRAAEGRTRPGRNTPPPRPGRPEPPPPGGAAPWFPPPEDHGAAAGGRRPDLPYGYRYEDEAYPYGPRPYEWSPDRPGPPEKGPDGGTEAGGTGGATDAGPDAGPDSATDSGTDAPAGVRTGRPAMRVLPLGTGLVLVGLGLGFIGLRLRRG
ncbi:MULTISPECIES: hypothetical protein [Streptomyces]|uniref:Uncharacterized protein n=1 Tax=Streptomyces xinghaiensis TaxID=1038928 RepID=A0A420UVI9_9ACTN|nr:MULTISPECIES: hypothetical protein [Streptomyces]OFA49795.1 hypothetical protein BEN35_16265 [Streptomyces fradiae]PQM23039.1 hypothetical protein Sfr7A_10470 [Streptomyces xinghaiensis]RKM91405.1 hypothetical protein SFRA_028015 [Streptomyces xinghaiensis]